MEQMKIWFVVSEAQGLVKSGGLADVAKALPKALQNLGHQVSIVIPGYSGLPGISEAETLLSTELDFWPHIPYKIKKLELDGVAVYAIDCPQYFDRPELYAENNVAYADNGERFSFFSSASLDCLAKLGIQPDVVHANDWHTGLVPFLLKTRYRYDKRFDHVRSVLTVHNAIFQGIYSYDELSIIPELRLAGMEHLRYSHSHVGMLRAGLAYADKINAVSPNYAQELLTPLGSHGLVDDFNRRADDLCGILNGCDYSEWNPEHDEFLPLRYSSEENSMLAGKLSAKHLLQQETDLVKCDKPMFGMVCRLTHQKGFDYILPILRSFLSNDVQVVIVGTGDPDIANELAEIAADYPDKFAFVQAYSNRLAHLVEAGADFFLMPSEFEACGLNQIYSMAYGTLPIVREVGGLKDTVLDYDRNPLSATGFGFHYPDAKDLLITMQRALIFFLQDIDTMREVQIRAMRQDFSWERSAVSYLEMYQAALNR
ncbi:MULTISPECIES: glycogen synthase GlgA [unclassified Vibrio]|uniref:glycogen synthase GlgA n=1 Tax=unclassified Vibrio TaxID=2614977 RepID=UPI0014934DDC|nr:MULTISPECIES: glycogen synthase GlgA [unclassified Vibrio]NOI68056.1 glycogen synthase GlgA [Vibrio sp. 99-8-1]